MYFIFQVLNFIFIIILHVALIFLFVSTVLYIVAEILLIFANKNALMSYLFISCTAKNEGCLKWNKIDS